MKRKMLFLATAVCLLLAHSGFRIGGIRQRYNAGI